MANKNPQPGDCAQYAVQVLDRAINSGLLSNRSTIDPHVVRRNLKKKSKISYFRVMDIWNEYEKRWPESDPRDMPTMKHFAEVLGLGLIARLDKEGDMATTWTVKTKLRQFHNQWERVYHTTIPEEVKLSMAPYVDGELAERIGLSNKKKDKPFFTKPHYIRLYDLMWTRDFHEYRHEGSRVDASTLLNTHCYTSARLQEVCGAQYRDIICLVGWKDKQLDIKMDFKRRICKGLDHKQPEHPFAERFEDEIAPMLFSQPMLWWLVNFLSAGAFRDYQTVDEVFGLSPAQGEDFCIIEWADNVLDKPVFPEWSADGKKSKAKSHIAWAHDVKEWGARADISNLSIHAIRREILIQVTDSGAPSGQVKKFAAQRNDQVLASSYLHDLTTIDGAACFLGMKQRTDLTMDFRTATMKSASNSGPLPSRLRTELHDRDDYVTLSKQIENLGYLIDTAANEEDRNRYKTNRIATYKKRTKLEEKERKKHAGERHQSDWRKTHFDRIRHMMPERNRLADTLFMKVSLRSPEGISAINDLVTLRTNDCRVVYQDTLRPVRDRNLCWRCPVSSCSREMNRIPVGNRWDHIFRCQERVLKQGHGYAKFCYLPLCSKWITNEAEWSAHCQSHIDKGDIPSRCDPVKFRHAVACAGYCPFHLGDKTKPAVERMQSFPDRSAWQRHISYCGPQYMKRQEIPSTLMCPLGCSDRFQSEKSFWHHLEDVHSTHEPQYGTKRKSCSDESQEEPQSLGTLKRRRNSKVFKSNKSSGANYIHMSAVDLYTTPADSDLITTEVATSSSGYSTPISSLFDVETTYLSGTPSLATVSPLPEDPNEIAMKASTNVSSCSTPLSSLFNFDMASESVAPQHISVSSQSNGNMFTFSAFEEYHPDSFVPTEETPLVNNTYCLSSGEKGVEMPILPALANLSMDMVDTALQVDTSAFVDSAAVESEDIMTGRLLGSYGSVAKENKENTTPHKTKVTRIILKVSGSPQAGLSNCLETNHRETPAHKQDYPVHCLLDKWAGWYFVQWLDGSCSWEPEEHILDDKLFNDLEERYRGLGAGVEVIRARRTSGRVEYRVHFIGRSKKEDKWVAEKYMSCDLVKKHRPIKKAKRGKRKS